MNDATRPNNVVEKYPYQDECRNILYTKVRTIDEHGKKSFSYERKENGKIVFNLEGCRRVLYRLPDLIYWIKEGKTIYLVEGEKDVHTLLNHFLAASTTPNTLIWEDEFTQILQNADVVILFDYDKTGTKRRDLLCKLLYGRVKRLRVVELPGFEVRDKHGQDITDWLQAGNAIEQFKVLVGQTPDYQPEATENSSEQIPCLKAYALEEFLALEIPKRKMLLEPILLEKSLVMLYAKRGVGKTHVVLKIAYAIASGGTFLDWKAPGPRKVLCIDGEMLAVDLQKILQRISCDETAPQPPKGYLTIISSDQQIGPMPDLGTNKGQKALEPHLDGIALIIIDNLSSLLKSGVENEAEDWRPFQDWLLEMRKRGIAVIFIHHAGKSGEQRGTSKREDILDIIIALKQPSDYNVQQGGCFEWHFEKTRGFAGEQAASFKVQIKHQIDGPLILTKTIIDHDPKVIEVANRRNKGETILKITQTTGLTKSQVETRSKKARQLNLLP